jgi:hypothetical protein
MALHFTLRATPNAGAALRRAALESQREIDKLGLVKLTEAEAGAVNAALKSQFIVNADPIRSAELRLEQWKVNQALKERTRAPPADVGSLMAQAIDAWVASIPVFREQAFEPDPVALYERISAFRIKAIEARDAAKAAF